MALLLAPFLAQVDALQFKHLAQRVDRFQGLLSHIEANLATPLRVPDLAAQMHLETAYFSQLFKSHFGQPPARYIRRRRIERAMELLLRTPDTLERIALACGFCDPYHLAKVFKQEAGIPPGAFRKRGIQP
jgi:transcriptional regulator GlxA family with amidase domain